MAISVSVLVALGAKSYEIIGRIITLLASRLDVMDLKTFHPSARLATPAVSLQDMQAELAISVGIKLQAWSFGTHSSQSVSWTFSRSCLICGLGRPSTN